MKQSADLLKEGRRAKQGIVVGNAKHADAPLSEEGVAKSITSLTARVRRPIDFDGEARAHAEEVSEVRADGKLAAKLEAIELASA